MTILPLQRFFKLFKADKQEIFTMYIYALFNGIVTLSVPLGIQAIINLISAGQVSTSWIILVVLVIVGVAFTGFMQILQLSVSENLQQKIFTRSAFEFAYRIPKLKMESVDKYYIPELVNRFFDTLSIQKGLSKILMDFSRATLQIVFGLVLLSLYHPFFILFSIVLVITVYFIFRWTAPEGLRASLIESTYKYEVAHWLEEIARAMETFKLAGKTPLPISKTDDKVAGYLTSRKVHFRSLLTQYIFLVGFKVVIAAGLLLIGGLLVINQQMNIGQFVASEIIIIMVLASVEKLILSMETIYDMLTAIEKLGKVTDLPLEEDTTGIRVNLEGDEGLSVNIKHLFYSFKNKRDDALKDINLSVKAGEKVCISGFNGSGKSLLLQIIAGLFEEFTGSVAYNNIPLGNWAKIDLRSVTGDSLAKEDIFKGSLRENISLGKPEITIDELQKVSDIVSLADFIESLPMGYETQLVPEGMNLPKSVRLKIMLARSLTGKRKLILLEDNFNQLNDEDTKRLLDFLLSKDNKCTLIVVSNDPAVAKQFDKVVVLDEGEIISFGKLDEMKDYEWFSKVFQN